MPHAPGPFAYLAVDRLRIYEPVYLGATEDYLAEGLVHMDGTALPLGGLGRHSVLVGHRGHCGNLMLRHLDRMEPGDEVRLSRNGSELRYRVIASAIAEPGDYNALRAVTGKDLLTLYSYDGVLSGDQRRLLVHCERIPGPGLRDVLNPPSDTPAPEALAGHESGPLPWPLLAAWTLSVAILFVILFYFSRYLRRTDNELNDRSASVRQR